MPFKVNCPHCGRVGSLSKPVVPGTPVRCPNCRNRFEIPAPADVNSQPPPFPNQIGLIQEPISDPLADLTTETPETKEGEPGNPESFFDSLELNESFYDSLELNEDHAPDAKIPVLPHSHREAEMSKQWEYKVLTQKDKLAHEGKLVLRLLTITSIGGVLTGSPPWTQRF